MDNTGCFERAGRAGTLLIAVIIIIIIIAVYALFSCFLQLASTSHVLVASTGCMLNYCTVTVPFNLSHQTQLHVFEISGVVNPHSSEHSECILLQQVVSEDPCGLQSAYDFWTSRPSLRPQGGCSSSSLLPACTSVVCHNTPDSVVTL